MKKTRDLNMVAFAKRRIDLGTRVVRSKKNLLTQTKRAKFSSHTL
ncbi:hypothetical protein [Campylobacter gastrosuis]|uniref:Uncharacterized protein n=1 Tax=Campylobacter gastrosuis TaxID=2974576 RepID=A0ABT7HTE0_9BACT|nr:hypothetical protein [Campylobacter gastrosuis]MDL0089644.1 hypothetical protein [Campylobacter gastrosuis]